MCYLRKHRGALCKDQRLKIAKTDIRVWKVLGPELASVVRGHQYTLGRTYRSPLNWFNLILARVLNWESIEHGFHAYTDKSGAVNNSFLSGLVVACTIPKGSLYYWNSKFGESVSSSIRVDGILQTDGSISDHNPFEPPPHVSEWIEEYLKS